MSNDRIEKRIDLKTPIARLWRALTDHRQFGEWFGVKMDGPFCARSGGRWPGSPSWLRALTLEGPDPEDGTANVLLLHPASLCRQSQPRLLLLVLGESAFENIPAQRRNEAFIRNDGGRIEQIKNIETYVAQKP